MDEQDKTPWAGQPAEAGTVGVDLLAGASVKSGQTPRTEEPAPEEDSFIPPWMTPETQEAEHSEATGPSRSEISSDQLKAAIGLAIADVRNVSQGQGEARDAATILQGQSLDPKTAAVVASAMASVFSGLSDTRFSAQRPGAAQAGFEGFDNAEEIFRMMMGGSVPHDSEEAETPQPVESAAAPDFRPGPSDSVEHPPRSEVIGDFVDSSGGAKVTGEASVPPRQQKSSATSSHRKISGRGKDPYYGLRGRRTPQRIKIARTARAKGMRGQPNFSKTSLNLAVQVKTLSSPSRAIPLFLLAVVLILAFAKFGVIDQYQRLSDAQAVLADVQNEADQIQSSISDYADVQQSYQRYNDQSWMNEAEKNQVDVLSVLDIIQRDLPSGKVRLSSVILTNNELDLTVSGIDLNELSQIVASLKAEPLIQFVLATDLSHTDEIAMGALEGGTPGTYKIKAVLGKQPADTGTGPEQSGGTAPEDAGSATPEGSLEQPPEEEPVVPERPVLPGEAQVGG